MDWRTARCLRIVLFVVTISCMQQSHEEIETAQVVVPDDSSTRIAHTLEDLYRDPEDRTYFMLRQLRRLVGDYRDSTGKVPLALGDVLNPSLAPGYRLMALHDAWGVPFRYSRGGEELELRSAGPDEEFGSGDDLVESWRP